jgi:diguanylate cyclase (GGDEF)-like protein
VDVRAAAQPYAKVAERNGVNQSLAARLGQVRRTGTKQITPVMLDGKGAGLRKTWPVHDGAGRLQHEEAILHRLDGLAGVPRLLVPCDGTCLFLRDYGLELLSEAPPARERLPGVARQVAEILAAVHARGVIHKNVSPATIGVDPDGRAMLVDFDLATTFAEERPGFTHPGEINGTLAYLAPEQTGRTGQPLDQRADLYAFGATLYELATGTPPFGNGEPLQLIYDHLARIPVPPIEIAPHLRPDLSDLIMRLLEKEPDRRYQSADGVAYDLAEIERRSLAGNPEPVRLGTRDFALRLSAPSRLIGRDAEVATLRAAFEDAMGGQARGILVAGGPGVGKTALINELRPIVTARRGWLAMGKFDQIRRDLESDAVVQALRTLGRLLLAEPDAVLDDVRERLLAALGGNAPFLAAALPEFRVLLGLEPVAGEQTEKTAAGLLQAQLAVLRVLAADRPVVVVVDDLQWAATYPMQFFDAVLADPSLRGVLLVGSYRTGEVDPAHPLALARDRWTRLGTAPPVLRLANLPGPDLVAFLADMLRLEPERARALAAALHPHTGGNPYDTVELVDALRREGALCSDENGWQWDAAAVHGHVGHHDVLHLLVARIRALPGPTVEALTLLACLGGRVDLDLLRTGSGIPPDELAGRLVPALEDGLLVMEGAVWFRHDRVQQAAYEVADVAVRVELHLRLARNLAGAGGYRPVAAEQYLAAQSALTDPAECVRAAELLRSAAAGLRLVNGQTAERLLLTALDLCARAGHDAIDDLLTDLHVTRFALGRLDEADDVFARLTARATDPLRLVGATCVQTDSLTNRGRPVEALEVAGRLLADLGVRRPDDFEERIPAHVRRLVEWGATLLLEPDERPVIAEPAQVAVCRLLDRMLNPAYFADKKHYLWVITECHRHWVDLGPHPALLSGLGRVPTILIGLAGQYRTAYAVGRHVLVQGERHHNLSAIRWVFAAIVQPWFEPLEANLPLLEVSRQELLEAGDLQSACFTYNFELAPLLDVAPTLEVWEREVQAGIAMAERTDNRVAALSYEPSRQLARALRGEPTTGFDDEAPPAAGGNLPTALVNFHVYRTLAAAIFNDEAGLADRSGPAMAALAGVPGTYHSVFARWLRCLALAATGDESSEEFKQGHEWLSARRDDHPEALNHLVGLVEAASTHGLSALALYDRALRAARGAGRVWHAALIAERAARAHLAHGLEESGRALMVQSWRDWSGWGATGKADALLVEFPFLRAAAAATAPAAGEGLVSSAAIDLLAVLRAARALSSETSVDRLRERVAEVLTELTGATEVHLVLRDDETRVWSLATPDGPVPVDDPTGARLLPYAAFRYAQRTGQPLLVADATADARFARDPYLIGVRACSLLVVPVLAAGHARAVLVLANTLSREAFTADRLDTVDLLAGQLAVSLENALLLESMERKVADRTAKLAAANEQLARLSMTDSLTGLANRRRFDEQLHAAWAQADTEGRPLSLLMVDVDHFKLYNDRYGHVSGDDCLARVAGALAAQVRWTDLLARYGGEEFAVVLPESGKADAAVLGERLCAAVAALELPHERSDHGRVTISVGMASLRPAPGGRPEELVEAADASLYEAKRAGRNRVAS